MAKQTARSEQRLVDLGRTAINRTDDLESEKIGEHPVREIEDCADLFAVFGTAAHQGGITILENHHEFAVGVMPAFLGPKTDELGVGQNSHGGWRNKIETMRLLEGSHEVSQIGGFSGAGRAFEQGQAAMIGAHLAAEVRVPVPAASAVMQLEGLVAQDGVGAEWDGLKTDFASGFNQMKGAAGGNRGSAIRVVKLGHQTFGFDRSLGKADDPRVIDVQKRARAELKGEVVPLFGAGLAGQTANRAEKSLGVFRNGAFQIPGTRHATLMQAVASEGHQDGGVRFIVTVGISAALGQIADHGSRGVGA